MTKGFRELKEKLSPMNWGERIEYLWTNHKDTILIFAAMLAIVIYLASGMVNNRKNIWMGAILANVNLSEEGTAYISSQYYEKYAGQSGEQEVKLTNVRLDSLKNEDTMEMTYYTLTQTLSLLGEAEVDYLLTDKTALELYLSQNIYLDLRKIFSAELLSDLNDKLIKLKTVDDEGNVVAEYPVAIDISYLPFIQSCSDATGPVYFGVAANGPNQDKILDFWNHLNNWKPAA